MSDSKPPNLSKWSVFVGIYLVRIFSGIPWIWGNLSVYCSSYFYANGMGSASVAGPWLITANNIGCNVGLLVSTSVSKKFGLLKTMIAITFIYNGCVLLSFYTLQHSYIALCVSFGLVAGFCGGVNEANQIILIVHWTESYKGVSSSSILSSNILGSVLINFLLTFYINPGNLKTTLTVDNLKLFTQPELLERVSYGFLLYGGLSLGVNCVGFLMLRVNTSDEIVGTRIVKRITALFLRQRPAESQPIVVQSETNIDRCYLTSSPSNQIVDNNEPCGNGSEDCHIESECHTTNNSEGEGEKDKSLTPRQIIKTLAFYTLFSYLPIITIPSIAVNTYYKAFGLLYIPDDHFLSSIAIFKCLFSPVATAMGGYSMDKVGVKRTMIWMSTLVCILSCFLFITPIINKWFYFFWCMAYGGITFACYCMVIACCLKLFGNDHLRVNYGLIALSNFLSAPVSAALMEIVLERFGWELFFVSFGFVSLVGLILIIVGIPDAE